VDVTVPLHINYEHHAAHISLISDQVSHVDLATARRTASYYAYCVDLFPDDASLARELARDYHAHLLAARRF
jgi:hypothetical protein